MIYSILKHTESQGVHHKQPGAALSAVLYAMYLYFIEILLQRKCASIHYRAV